jgi:hypothetical protein
MGGVIKRPEAKVLIRGTRAKIEFLASEQRIFRGDVIVDAAHEEILR